MVRDVAQDHRTPVTQLVFSLHVILVEILYKEDENVDKNFVWDSVDGIFQGFKLSATRLDHANFRLGIVEKGEKIRRMTLSKFKPLAKGVEFNVDMIPSGHGMAGQMKGGSEARAPLKYLKLRSE